jgi:hypothetical protein
MKAKYKQPDNFSREGFKTSSVVLNSTKKIGSVKEIKPNDSDMLDGRSGFKRSNPEIYVPDFVGAATIQQSKFSQKVHLSNESLKKIAEPPSSKNVIALSGLLLTQDLDKKTTMHVISEIQKLDPIDRRELDKAIFDAGDNNAAQLLQAIDSVGPPNVIGMQTIVKKEPVEEKIKKEKELRERYDFLGKAGVALRTSPEYTNLNVIWDVAKKYGYTGSFQRPAMIAFLTKPSTKYLIM